MTRSVLVAMLMAVATLPCSSRAAEHGPQSCLVEVLHSEMLPVGRLFYHTIKARLLVTPADRQPFETTVERVISWQAPPPRQGQRTWVPCESVLAQSGFWLF